jgi:MFS family permease
MQTLKRIYGASFIFSLSLALTAYVNSSFLSEHLGEDAVGILYAAAALTTLIGLEVLPRLIKRLGNRTIIISLIIINILALTFMRLGLSSYSIGAAFVLFNSSNTLIWYCLDIFIEHYSANKKVGAIRGSYLSLTNFAWLFAPILAGAIVSALGFSSLYTIVMIAIVVVAIVLRFSLSSYHDGKYRALSTFGALKAVTRRPDLFRITFINFILQFFYAWMVVYTPMYLHEVHGIGFPTIGVMFTIMLVAFVIFQYPIGRLIDLVHHEREFLQAGVVIMAVTTFLFGYSLTESNILILALILFGTRVGASIIEVVSEGYFFRSVSDSDAEIISLFRSTTPLAYLIAPLIATIVLAFTTYNMLFMILGGIILLALFALDRLSNISA